jgi:glycosyltransferase involved in cell wall biosynthesis
MTNRARKVLFISPQPFFQWRGSPIRVAFDVQALAELGYRVDLLTLPVGQNKPIPGVCVFRVPNVFRVRDLGIGPSLLKAAFDVLLLLKGLAMTRRNRYAIIHGVEDAGAIGVVIAGWMRCRLVFEKHSDPSSHRGGWWRNAILRLYAAVERFTIRHADAVITTGPGLAEQARQLKPTTAVHDIFDIPSSLEPASDERAAEIRRLWERKPGDVLVAYVGSFAVYQGVDLMFEAMPEVVRQRPEVRFVIIGGTEAEIAARKKWLAGRGIAEAVVFAGKVPPDRLPSHLRAADILLSPRLAGVNTPLKLLDYLKVGRAIAATDTPANRLILNDKLAVLTPPTAAAFAAGIVRLVGDPVLRRTLADNGRHLIDIRYNYVEFKKRLAECYAGLLANGEREP